MLCGSQPKLQGLDREISIPYPRYIYIVVHNHICGKPLRQRSPSGYRLQFFGQTSTTRTVTPVSSTSAAASHHYAPAPLKIRRRSGRIRPAALSRYATPRTQRPSPVSTTTSPLEASKLSAGSRAPPSRANVAQINTTNGSNSRAMLRTSITLVILAPIMRVRKDAPILSVRARSY